MNTIPRWLTITLASLLALLIVIVGIGQAAVSWSRIHTTPSGRTITISAEGKVTATPDVAEVSASIVSNGSTASSTQSDMDTKASQLVAYLEKSGVAKSDISTTDYSLYPQYNTVTMPLASSSGVVPSIAPVGATSTSNQITGYSASETLTAKIHDLTTIGTVLGGITQNGANQIQSVQYSIDNPNNLQEQAREQALTNAAQKAQALATAAHVKLGSLITFTDDSSSTPPVYPMAMSVGASDSAMSAPAASVPTGTQEITEDVSVTYQLK